MHDGLLESVPPHLEVHLMIVMPSILIVVGPRRSQDVATLIREGLQPLLVCPLPQTLD